MSGGIAYVWDGKRDLYKRVNKSMVELEPVTEKHDIEELRGLIEEHYRATGSVRAKEILDNFGDNISLFKKIMPRDYDRMLRAISQFEERGMSHEEAAEEAFYLITRGGAR